METENWFWTLWYIGVPSMVLVGCPEACQHLSWCLPGVFKTWVESSGVLPIKASDRPLAIGLAVQIFRSVALTTAVTMVEGSSLCGWRQAAAAIFMAGSACCSSHFVLARTMLYQNAKGTCRLKKREGSCTTLYQLLETAPVKLERSLLFVSLLV